MKRFLAILGAALISLFLAAPATLAAEPLPHNGRVVVSTEGDVTVPAGDHADLLVVVRGTAFVQGEVNTVVAVDGAVELSAAHVESVVAIRSPVEIGADTVVSGDVMKLDSLVHQVGNAEVAGEVKDIAGMIVGLGAVIAPALILLWVGFAVATIAAALLLAGIAARQVRSAEAIITRQPLLSFVAGLLGLVVTPVVAVVLMVTIVGAPLGVGILLGLWPLVAFVGYLVAAVWIGDWVLARLTPGVTRERPYLAAVLGTLILGALGLVPVLTIVSGIASLVGFGAVLVLASRTIGGTRATQAAPGSAPAPIAG